MSEYRRVLIKRITKGEKDDEVESKEEDVEKGKKEKENV